MTDSNQLFNEIVSELTKPGEIFETREIQDENGNSFSEYVTFPDNLKGYFDFGLLHADKDFLVMSLRDILFKETISKSSSSWKRSYQKRVLKKEIDCSNQDYQSLINRSKSNVYAQVDLWKNNTLVCK